MHLHIRSLTFSGSYSNNIVVHRDIPFLTVFHIVLKTSCCTFVFIPLHLVAYKAIKPSCCSFVIAFLHLVADALLKKRTAVSYFIFYFSCFIH